MAKRIQFSATGGRKSCNTLILHRSIRRRRSADREQGDRHQLHRHLCAQRAVRAGEPAERPRHRGGRRGGQGRRRGQRDQTGRPGGVCAVVARCLQRSPQCARRKVALLPHNLSFEQGAASFLKGLTVHYLLRQTHDVQPGEVFLFHAAAGGVGLIACQWAKALGARLIGSVGSDEKAALAKQAGAGPPSTTTKRISPSGWPS